MTADFRIPIVNWSHGTLNPGHADKLECELLSDVENPKKHIAILATDNKHHSYLSKRDDPPFCNNFMVIRNRKTNTVRFFATDQYLMSPYCASEKKKSNSLVKSEDDKTSKLNSSINLSKVMGSKRNKRKIIELEKTNFNVDNIEKKLKKAIKDEQINIDEDVKPAVTTNTAILPPCNRAAESVESVYDIRELMSSELLDSLEIIAQEVMNYSSEELSEDTRFTKFFTTSLSRIDKTSVLKVKMLLFADSLLQFLSFPARGFRSKSVIICQYSSSLNEKLINDFCASAVGGKWTRPQSMRDKALCYILVLLLLINDFTANVSVLSEPLPKTDYAKLPRLMRAVGARPVDKSPVEFCLKLPLAELSVFGGGRVSFGKKR